MDLINLYSKSLIIVFLITICHSINSFAFVEEGIVQNLDKTSIGRYHEISSKKDLEIKIFCRESDSKNLINYFRTANLRIVSPSDDIKIIKGSSGTDVYYQYKHSTKWLLWAFNLLPLRIRDTNFATFNSSCIGISTDKPYSVSLVIRALDPWNLTTFLSGFFLYYMSTKLAKSTAFFYTSGTILGAVGAALIFLYLVTRFLPRGRLSNITLSGLWMMALYFCGEIWGRFEELVQEKLTYILVYLTTGALIAFLTCYRFGPPAHPRTLDIIKWALQLVGLILIYMSSELIEISTAIIFMTLFYNKFGEYIIYQTKSMWLKKFPPEAKFITEEDFISQGAHETQKSLKELREFCSSPKCDAWKVVTRLKNPKRFSTFMKGSSHLSDEELLAYESEQEIIDDDDEDEEEVSENVNVRGRRNSTENRETLLTDDSDSDLIETDTD